MEFFQANIQPSHIRKINKSWIEKLPVHKLDQVSSLGFQQKPKESR